MKEELRAIIVCVDFADFLKITLPYNKHHFSDVCVVTSLSDRETIDYAFDCGFAVHSTNSFYEPGAVFNKFKALEEALDVFGRHGWICLMDVDILLPKTIPDFNLQPNILYGPYRRVMEKPSAEIPDDWSEFPLYLPRSRLIAGHTQIFHADDPHLGVPPWHQMDWKHAAGGDYHFQAQWPDEKKVRLDFDTLHLGEVGINWCGRLQPHLDGTPPANTLERTQNLERFTRKVGYLKRGSHEPNSDSRYTSCELQSSD